ncbi:hypothetical protein [Edaphobacter modestus]|uniref:SnoaL-like protein n=1 Tax=Edaphobacter modestus TaxID=388466 RepID=A0A4Q7YWI8_9BACT|nr:hypothetical protein [Edaphobacter modestus]RZU42187.1 hypothetical protein BDD14_3735 [Edaphobacter modestus]
MLTNLLIIPTVKAAVEALQNVDRDAWNRLFTPKAVLYDDGSPRDLKRFTQESFGRERFICIDRVANNGFYIEGDFRSDESGTFRAYFNFELNDSGRIVRLDIGKVEDVA